MKLRLFVVGIGSLFYVSSSNAQCDLHTKTDEFTGKTTVWTDRIKITHGGLPTMLKGASDNDCTYRVYLKLVAGNGKIVLSISEDSDGCFCKIQSVSFKFDNGEVLTKSNCRFGQNTKTVLGQEQFSYFDITKEELLLLSKNSIDKFRIRESNCSEHTVIEEEMDTKAAKKLQGIAKCIYQN